MTWDTTLYSGGECHGGFYHPTPLFFICFLAIFMDFIGFPAVPFQKARAYVRSRDALPSVIDEIASVRTGPVTLLASPGRLGGPDSANRVKV